MVRLDSGCEDLKMNDKVTDKSSQIHISTKFVSVTQTLEEVNGGVRPELVLPDSRRIVRSSIAAFVCCTFVVGCLLMTFILYFIHGKAEFAHRLDVGIKEPWYLRRGDWYATPDYELEFLELPVDIVLIGHSELEHCTEQYNCMKLVLGLQRDCIRRGWNDIGPNFLVGGNGLVVEGRGANVLGSMVRSWNKVGVSVMFLGDYSQQRPSPSQIEHVSLLLEELVKLRVLKPDYAVYGHCQVVGTIRSPGHYLVESLHHFTHWRNVNSSNCIDFNPN